MTELVLGRLARLRQAIADAGCDAGIFYDPTTIRYATDISNMQVYSLHNPCRYVVVPASGPVTLFEFKGAEHLADASPAVDDVRPAISWYDFVSGPRVDEFAFEWATEIVALVGRRTRVAVDRLDPLGTDTLRARGIHVADGQAVANRARAVKTAAEVDAMRRAVAAGDDAIEQMCAACAPGITEQELWAELHRANIALGGEWIETRLLTSGHRTNPWYQECSDKVIEAGDLVAFDTDLIGIDGYSVDVSRTWLAGDVEPAAAQLELHDAALEQLEHNIELFTPGASFAEICAKAHLVPPHLHSVTNAAIAHGIGMCNEFPLILNQDHFDASGYDGEIRENMVLCVEALAAPPRGTESVKLEDQILVTADGPEVLSKSPLGLRLG